jgi:hypothetical protein
MNETQNRIREPVKSAARTDTVTGIPFNRRGMINDGYDEEKIFACGALTASQAITMHSSHAAVRVVALTVGFLPESYFPRHSGCDPRALKDSLDRPRMTG